MNENRRDSPEGALRNLLRGAEPWGAGAPLVSSAAISGLHLLGLTGLAVAQPVYDVVGRSANFLVAHDAQPADVAALVLALSLFLPLALMAIELLVALVGRGAARWLHRGLVALLLGAFVLQVMKRAPLPGGPLVVLAAALGISGVAVYARRAGPRGFLTVLAPAALAFPLHFLFATPVASLLDDGSPSQATAGRDGPSTPVVVVILDELSLSSIMDGAERIDARRYPHLAALAAGSYWFRNATTVSTDTVYAVPAILSGRYPDRPRLATAADYPQTLLTLLGRSHDLEVFECVTSLCPAELCGAQRPPLVRRLEVLFSDLYYVYLHVLLPADLASGLPWVSATWRDFGERTANDSGGFTATHRVGGPDQLDRFLTALRSGRDSTLYLTHLLLPHWPWELLPSGKEYGPLAMPVSGWAMPTPPDPARGRGYYWGEDDWSVIQAFQRYLLQVGFLDRMIGELTATLKEAGLYESSLLVVVADHGISFLPGEPRKQLTDGSDAAFSDIVNVPLFVKLPGQRQGETSDRNVQTIDVLPTVADALGLEIPWPVDGVSAIDFGRPDEPEKRAANSLDRGSRRWFAFDLSRLKARRESLAWMSELFGSGDDRDGLFRIGPRPQLLGRAVGAAGAAVRAAAGSLAVELDDPPELVEHYDPGSAFAPVHLAGRVSGAGDGPLEIAVAVNGVVRATTRSFERQGEGGFFTAMVPESALEPGRNRVELFAVSETGGPIELSPIPRRSAETYALKRLDNGDEAVVRNGDAVRVVAGAVRGAVEEVARRTASGWAILSGWAADVAGNEAAERVVVFADGRFAGAIEPGGARPDVAGLYSRKGILRCGFGLAVPPSLFPDEAPRPEVRIFAVARRGVASELAPLSDGGAVSR